MSKLMGLLLITTLFLVSADTRRAGATIVFSKPFGVTSGSGSSYVVSDFAANMQRADSFSLQSSVSVSALRWWGAYANNQLDPTPPTTDTFYVRFFQHGQSSLPEQSPLFQQIATTVVRTPTAVTLLFGFRVYEFAADFGNPLGLDAGVTYDISIVRASQDSQVWSWACALITGPGEDIYTRPNDAANWSTISAHKLSLELSDASLVPEPSCAAMFGLMLVTFFACRFQFRGSVIVS